MDLALITDNGAIKPNQTKSNFEWYPKFLFKVCHNTERNRFFIHFPGFLAGLSGIRAG